MSSSRNPWRNPHLGLEMFLSQIPLRYPYLELECPHLDFVMVGVRVIFLCIEIFFNKMHFTCNWVDLKCA